MGCSVQDLFSVYCWAAVCVNGVKLAVALLDDDRGVEFVVLQMGLG
jgi:hypothetical protein